MTNSSFPLQKNISVTWRARKQWMITACITEWLTYVGTQELESVTWSECCVCSHWHVSGHSGKLRGWRQALDCEANRRAYRDLSQQSLNFITGFKNAQQCCYVSDTSLTRSVTLVTQRYLYYQSTVTTETQGLTKLSPKTPMITLASKQ